MSSREVTQMADKKEERSSGSRERLLVAAEEVFAEHGFDGARVEQIAARAGVNIRMLYHHFGSKEGLFEAVGDGFDHEIIARQDQVFFADERPRAILRRFVEDVWDFLETHPNFVRIAGWSLLQKDRLGEFKHPVREYAATVLQPRLEELAQQDGWNPLMNPTHIMLLGWSAVFLWFLNREDFHTFCSEETGEAKDRAYREFLATLLESGPYSGSHRKESRQG